MPDYFAPAASPEEEALRRIKGTEVELQSYFHPDLDQLARQAGGPLQFSTD